MMPSTGNASADNRHGNPQREIDQTAAGARPLGQPAGGPALGEGVILIEQVSHGWSDLDAIGATGWTDADWSTADHAALPTYIRHGLVVQVVDDDHVLALVDGYGEIPHHSWDPGSILYLDPETPGSLTDDDTDNPRPWLLLTEDPRRAYLAPLPDGEIEYTTITEDMQIGSIAWNATADPDDWVTQLGTASVNDVLHGKVRHGVVLRVCDGAWTEILTAGTGRLGAGGISYPAVAFAAETVYGYSFVGAITPVSATVAIGTYADTVPVFATLETADRIQLLPQAHHRHALTDVQTAAFDDAAGEVAFTIDPRCSYTGQIALNAACSTDPSGTEEGAGMNLHLAIDRMAGEYLRMGFCGLCLRQYLWTDPDDTYDSHRLRPHAVGFDYDYGDTNTTLCTTTIVDNRSGSTTYTITLRAKFEVADDVGTLTIGAIASSSAVSGDLYVMLRAH